MSYKVALECQRRHFSHTPANQDWLRCQGRKVGIRGRRACAERSFTGSGYVLNDDCLPALPEVHSRQNDDEWLERCRHNNSPVISTPEVEMEYVKLGEMTARRALTPYINNWHITVGF